MLPKVPLQLQTRRLFLPIPQVSPSNFLLYSTTNNSPTIRTPATCWNVILFLDTRPKGEGALAWGRGAGNIGPTPPLRLRPRDSPHSPVPVKHQDLTTAPTGSPTQSLGRKGSVGHIPLPTSLPDSVSEEEKTGNSLCLSLSSPQHSPPAPKASPACPNQFLRHPGDQITKGGARRGQGLQGRPKNYLQRAVGMSLRFEF